MHRSTRWTLPLAALLLLALSAPALALAPGDPAPDFSLADSNGVTTTLSELRGKVVVLKFFGFS